MIGSIIIGIIAGLLACKFTGSESKGCFINLFLGLVGGAFGGWLFGQLGIHLNPGWIGELITAVVGAALLLWIWDKIRS